MRNDVFYDTSICPICGNKARHPTTGWVNKDKETWDKFLDDKNYCLIEECVDESDSTIGYDICCKNEFAQDDLDRIYGGVME